MLAVYNQISERIKNLEIIPGGYECSVGTIEYVEKGFILARGLERVACNELVEIETGSFVTELAMAFALNLGSVTLLPLSKNSQAKAGQTVRALGRPFSVEVNYNYLGRVLGGDGKAIDGRILSTHYGQKMPVINHPTPLSGRNIPQDPIELGNLGIDFFSGMAKGQRCAIITPDDTQNDTLTINAAIHQKDQDTICVYCITGKIGNRVRKLMEELTIHSALDNSVIVYSGPQEPLSLQYLAPMTATAVAEYFAMQGRDVLLVLDGMGTHSEVIKKIYQIQFQNSKLPPEDYIRNLQEEIVSTQTRIIERVFQYKEEYGAGSITSLNLFEEEKIIKDRDLFARITSVCDKHLYLQLRKTEDDESMAFNMYKSFPEINQSFTSNSLRCLYERITLQLIQQNYYLTYPGSEEQKSSTLTRRELLFETVQRLWDTPLRGNEQILVIFMIINNFLDNIPPSSLKTYILDFLEYAQTHHEEMVSDLSQGQWSNQKEKNLRMICLRYRFITN
jgi:F-type H+/Na+-transporting ATPase subunit alpha